MDSEQLWGVWQHFHRYTETLAIYSNTGHNTAKMTLALEKDDQRPCDGQLVTP